MPGLTDLFGAFAPVPFVLRADRRVTAAHALTYGALAYRLGAEGAGTVRLRNVVEGSWRSSATVRRHLDDLEAWGYVHRKRSPGRPTFYRLDRLVLEQLELELGANPAHLGEHANPAHDASTLGRGNPARSYAKNPARAREHTPKTFQDKTGEGEDRNGEADLEGWRAAVAAHPWRPLRPVTDEAQPSSPADDA